MRIAIVGAGNIGSTLAKLWIDAGHEVLLSSRHPAELQPLIGKLGARATAGTPREAAAFGDVVLLAVPLKAVSDIARDIAPALEGKVVIDAGNAYAGRDGSAAIDAEADPEGSAGWTAAMFRGSKWVKAFNTVNYNVLQREAHRPEKPIGVPIAGDSKHALDVVAGLISEAGFDPVVVGPLARGKEFEPGTRPYGSNMSGQELREFWSADSDRHRNATARSPEPGGS